MRRPHLAVAVVAASLVAVPGCGGSSDADGAKHAMTDFMAAIGKGDGKKACALADESGRQRLVQAAKGKLSCEDLVAAIAARLPADVRTGLQNAEVKKVTVKGDRATIKDSDISAKKGKLSGFLESETPTKLVKQGGEWKVSGD